MGKYDYDLIVIGGGGGGITAAMYASGLGKKVAMLDRNKFGGECTWSGCVPSKALLHASKTSHLINNPEKHGLSYSRKPAIKYNSVLKGVRDVVLSVYSHEKPANFKKAGIKAMEKVKVKFIDPHTISVNGKKMTSEKFIITTGSSPMIPPVDGLNKAKIYTNENIFSLTRLPKSMIVMGGGPIGIELASAFNRLGVQTTVIEMAPVILFREDQELSDILSKILIDEGVKILTGAKLVKVEGKSKIGVTYEKDGKKKKISADLILVSAGRKPNIENLDLEKAGIAYDKRGITTNENMKTSADNIYAAGDVVGPYQFSHIANYQAIVAITNAFLPIKKKTDYRHVPWCTFTDPELARSGLTEDEAREKFGSSVKIFKSYYSEIDRGITDRSENGMAKIICNRKGNILGIHIIGERAGELMQELHLAKSLGIPLYKLDSVIHSYPQYSDLLKVLARKAYIDKIQSNFFIKVIKKLRSSKPS